MCHRTPPPSSSSSFLHPSTILRRTPTPATNPRRPLTVRAARGKLQRAEPDVTGTPPSFLLFLLPPPLHHPPPHPHPRHQPPPPPHRPRRTGTTSNERTPTSTRPHRSSSSSSSFLHPSTIIRRTPTPATNPRRPLTVRAAGGKIQRNIPHVNIRTSATHPAASAAAAASPLAHRHSAPSPRHADPVHRRQEPPLGSQRRRDPRSRHQQPRLNAPLLLLHHASTAAAGILPFRSRAPSSIHVVVAQPLRIQVTFPSAMVFTWCFLLPLSHLTWYQSSQFLFARDWLQAHLYDSVYLLAFFVGVKLGGGRCNQQHLLSTREPSESP
ncbi:hypothetical protein Fmac_031981 [Flemingia macrophylla]|uniref:Uncharacterized protein n=1 Tax=Flemingia macrophylla TaxID=520843 RepID=A0ABD1L3L3_9FABA